jgi:hypothetical protein
VSESGFVTSANPANQPEKKKKKRGGLALIIGGAVLAAAVGGVFASNVISINGDGGIELGNGVSTTTSCTAAASTTVNQDWDANAGSYGDFVVSSIAISDIDSVKCDGKTLKVLLIDGLGNVICGIDGTHTSDLGANAEDALPVTSISSNYTVTLTGHSANAGCSAASVDRVALDTSN